MPIQKTLNCSFIPDPISYEITFGEELFEEAVAFAKTIASHPVIMTTESVYKFLPPSHEEILLLPSGEEIKSRAMKAKIEDMLIEKEVGKESCFIAIGGGTVLDLVGFIAATYCRGVPYISFPTTLLAMTDAAIGGKTGVNVEEAKNWIGAFYHPRKIFIDLHLLKTLPEKEALFGLSESLKHSLIADADFFMFIRENAPLLIKRDKERMQELIYRSCLIKKGIIEQDPYEKKGVRRILNFGHTIGHALETLSGYRCAHGEAVVMGMLLEAHLSCLMGYLSMQDLALIESCLKLFPFQMNFPKSIPFEMLKRDKKGGHRFVVLTSIGSVASFGGEYTTSLSETDLKEALANVVRNNQTRESLIYCESK